MVSSTTLFSARFVFCNINNFYGSDAALVAQRFFFQIWISCYFISRKNIYIINIMVTRTVWMLQPSLDLGGPLEVHPVQGACPRTTFFVCGVSVSTADVEFANLLHPRAFPQRPASRSEEPVSFFFVKVTDFNSTFQRKTID